MFDVIKSLKLRKKHILMVALIALLIFETGCAKKFIQYNSNDISIRPCITINEDIQREYICEVSGYEIYTINLEEIYFIDIKAKQIELKEALTENLLTMEDVLSVCNKQSQNGTDVYMGENYKIIQNNKTYLFAPKDYEE